jgi:DNA helicase-2/ATP-dependent DNA helicase PcrA
LFEAARTITETDELRTKPRGALRGLIEDFDRWRRNLEPLPHAELTGIVLDESGYTEMWQRDKSPEAPGRLDNLKELVAGLGEFENLQGFLEHVSLVMENEENAGEDKVNLMTLHAAKGLEFDHVFLPGWEEGLFPHQRAMDESGLRGLEEERRLAYVGLTRARKRAWVLFAASRRIYNQWQNTLPSRFIDELGNDNVERMSEQGIYGGGRAGEAGSGLSGRMSGGLMRAPFSGAARRPAASPVIDGEALEVSGTAGQSGFSLGQRVFHQKFGYGRIQLIEGNKLEVAFEKSSTKKVMDSFVEPV